MRHSGGPQRKLLAALIPLASSVIFNNLMKIDLVSMFLFAYVLTIPSPKTQYIFYVMGIFPNTGTFIFRKGTSCASSMDP